jgi:nitrogen regulatory protein P-II 1
MTRITVFIKPHRLEPVKSAMAAAGANGLSVGDVRGVGNSREESSLFGGAAVLALPIRARIEAIVPDEVVLELVDQIVAVAQTGGSDDGKVFLEKVSDAIRIRTGEHGLEAL